MPSSYPRRLVPWLLASLIIAVLMYTVGLLVRLYPSNLNLHPFLHAALTDGLRDLSIAIGTAVILALGVDLFMHKDLLDRINDKFIIIRAAESVGLKNIFVRRIRSGRGSSRPNHEFDQFVEDIITDQLKRNHGEIRMICVAAPEYLNANSSVGIALLDYYADKSTTNRHCKLRVLYQDPDCAATSVRSALESPANTRSHITGAISFLNELKGSCKDDLVQFRGYSKEASIFVIITDSVVCVEPLPLGILAELSRPLGGHTPICVYAADNETYRRWGRHFDYLWDNLVPAGITSPAAGT